MVIEWFQHFNITNVSIFFDKTIFFQILGHLFFFDQVIPDPGAKKSLMAFDNKLLTNFYLPWNILSIYQCLNVINFLIKLAFFQVI